MTTISPLSASDHDEWLPLWHGYVEFYRSVVPDDVTDATFARIVAAEGLHGAIARDAEGRAVGFVHWLYHPATWNTTTYCYLEDLFVSPDVRGGGVGRRLIAYVRAHAEASGSTKVYWLTEESNATARTLYDKVATLSGFVHYQLALTPAAG